MPLFAKEVNNPEDLSSEGLIAQYFLQEIPNHFSYVTLDAFVLMPDHLHMILIAQDYLKTKQKFSKPEKRSLVTIIKSYKSAVTRSINQLPDYDEYKVWQSGYYEHRIRDNYELKKLRQYIKRNPQKWKKRYDDISI